MFAVARASSTDGIMCQSQETRENAERKENDKDSAWAKPKNNNPLEKTGAAHGIGQGGAPLPHLSLLIIRHPDVPSSFTFRSRGPPQQFAAVQRFMGVPALT